MPSPNLFSAAEACAKLGKHVVSRLPFVGIPPGTEGTVCRIEQGIDGCCVVVVWYGLTPRDERWAEDWFSKALYAECLIEEP